LSLLIRYPDYRPHTHHVLFVHVPKTGGTTLTGIARRLFGRERVFEAYRTIGSLVNGAAVERAVEEIEKAEGRVTLPRFRFITGHAPFGMHRRLTHPSVYVSLVRNPIERCVSYYHHVLRDQAHRLHEPVVRDRMTLTDFVRSGLTPEMQDGQTQYFLDADRAEPLGFGQLELAKQNIERHFPLVGTLEWFDSSYLLLARLLGWRRISYRARNVSRGRTPLTQVPRAITSEIAERNAIDLELYAWVSRRLERQIASQGRGFQAELHWLRLRNRARRFQRRR
jgi:hypothetical protein